MGQVGCDLGEITNHHGSFDTQTVCFDEYTCFLKPHKEVVLFAFELDVTKASAAQHMATDAYVHLVLFIDPRGQHLEEFLKDSFTCQQLSQCNHYLFIIVLNSCCIALIGLNFIGAVGVGKKACNVRSKTRVTKLFVTGCAGG